MADPVNWVDTYGLFGWADMPTLPQAFVDGAAGFGDGLTGGITDWIRDGMGTNGAVNKCSSNYSNSHLAGTIDALGLGVGRLAYAGLAKGYAAVAPSGVAASAFRLKLRVVFGGGENLRPPNLAKYPTDDALRAAAGRTNSYVNAGGVGMATAGAASTLGGNECGCD
jgi:hypothetical protein